MTGRRRGTRRTALVALVATLGCGLMALGALPPAEGAVAAPGDRLPDLSTKRPTDVRIETTASGARRLRFTSTIVNVGDGPFETRGSRSSTSSAMTISQRVYNTSGGYRTIPTGAVARYAGDGHNHWHVQDVARYDVYPLTPGSASLGRDAKVGFCFFDTNTYDLGLPGAPSSRQYFESGCGTSSTLSTRNGISVGWLDRYPWNFAFQWITITGLPAGDYFLKYTVDPNHVFLEKVEGNNCTWARIRIPAGGSTVTVADSGWGCTLPGWSVGATPPPRGVVIIPSRP
ncbi:MAG TPA: lysyl oxidase family protein [Candidatus Limnocylindrales bacterium]|nr:lysyl oxidase family protein [Candidatus Limnocylindrales bacterium]